MEFNCPSFFGLFGPEARNQSPEIFATKESPMDKSLKAQLTESFNAGYDSGYAQGIGTARREIMQSANTLLETYLSKLEILIKQETSPHAHLLGPIETKGGVRNLFHYSPRFEITLRIAPDPEKFKTFQNNTKGE